MAWRDSKTAMAVAAWRQQLGGNGGSLTAAVVSAR
jgi:hypothetical protein